MQSNYVVNIRRHDNAASPCTHGSVHPPNGVALSEHMDIDAEDVVSTGNHL
jgi:hypothetical protein